MNAFYINAYLAFHTMMSANRIQYFIKNILQTSKLNREKFVKGKKIYNENMIKNKSNYNFITNRKFSTSPRHLEKPNNNNNGGGHWVLILMMATSSYIVSKR